MGAAIDAAAGLAPAERAARTAAIVEAVEAAIVEACRRPCAYMAHLPEAVECGMGNRALLWTSGYRGRSATFGRWRAGGFQVLKGSKGRAILRGGPRPGIGYVFGADQIRGLETWRPLELEPAQPAEILAACEAVAARQELNVQGANRREAGMLAAVGLLAWQGRSWAPAVGPVDRPTLRAAADTARALCLETAHGCETGRCPACAI